MSDETTLLPCPFCGGEAHVVSDYSSEHDETRWNLWHECCEHDGESAGYGHALFPWFETPWYKTEAEAIAAWNTRTHGTLTAEQVCEATYAHSIHADCADADWQAIADELNAELGSGTCEQVLTDCDDGLMPPFTAHCSACGAEWGFTPKFCPNCGCKVVSA